MKYLELLVLPIVGYFGNMFKEEIKQGIKRYIKSFEFKRNWHHAVYFALFAIIVTFLILLVVYR
ncbi:hypothetical protein [Salinimicrobium sp. HB62]|uniref:hypothetical protein n=1 Tax=Salinimicrobium sp. HB62 TaxID=3077781 RepID=UPI002D79ADDE|nr:hypothetical protein [Salinimicrobium sp. HB62]